MCAQFHATVAIIAEKKEDTSLLGIEHRSSTNLTVWWMLFAQIYMNVVYRLVIVRFGGCYLMRVLRETLKLASISEEIPTHFPLFPDIVIVFSASSSTGHTKWLESVPIKSDLIHSDATNSGLFLLYMVPVELSLVSWDDWSLVKVRFRICNTLELHLSRRWLSGSPLLFG